MDDNHEIDQVDNSFIDYGATIQTKPGVYLPKTDDQWAIAKDFFKSIFVNINLDSNFIDVNAVVKVQVTLIFEIFYYLHNLLLFIFNDLAEANTFKNFISNGYFYRFKRSPVDESSFSIKSARQFP